MAGRSCSPPACASKASCTAGPGQVAVEAEAAAHHVVARAREGDGARRVGGVQQRRPDAGRGQVGHEAVEEVELALGVGAVLRVARRRPRAGGSRCPRAAAAARATTAAAMARRSSGAAPTRCMPVSTLTWTATGRPGRGGGRAEGGDALGGVQRRREPVGQRGGRRGGVALAQQEHRRGDAVLAQLHPLVDQRHGEAPGAAGQRGPGHRRAAVAVAVGLDHRAELGRRGQAGQHRRVVRHRGQVDLGPGRARAALGHGHRGVLVRRDRGHQPDRGALSHRSVTPAPARTAAPPRSSGRSPATRPSAGPSDAARPCTWAASAAASSAGSPRARRRR